MTDQPLQESTTVEWRVLTFYGSIHMATIPAESEDSARAEAQTLGPMYSALIQSRRVSPWRDS